ncbi:hypothetical protein EVAR_34486_1 [Eumeta japonica]|uniref:Uncharacterized protein n=1 Tax=Eumeta variegata TaxID=151549 RepID=A0A4C1WUL3_EUMVA|nr:hypothetical protein EVAR_34486_1 [Eumeta japonica]
MQDEDYASIMTSPAITKSPLNQKNEKNEKKSPTHSTKEAPPADAAAQPPEPFSWLRVFKLADLMMKQGC